MNRKKETYDRCTVGERIQQRRLSLGLSQEQLAERIDRATKYYSDIERGICGMYVETMLAVSEHLSMSLDYMMYGVERNKQLAEEPSPVPLERVDANQLLEQCTEREYNSAMRFLELFIQSIHSDESKTVGFEQDSLHSVD